MKPINPTDIAPREKRTVYPEPFASLIGNREKRIIGDLFGLSNFGVNYTTLNPKAQSALKHAHTTQDEFIFVIEGNPTLYFGDEEFILNPGECFGFPKNGPAHHLVNNTDNTVTYLEIGCRNSSDETNYPNDDLVARMGQEGKWVFYHKNGTPYRVD